MNPHGRPPKPGSRRYASTYRGRQPVIDTKPLPMPSQLQGNAVATAFWEAQSGPLVADGRLNAENCDSFTMLCQYAADAEAAKAMLDAQGTVIVTTKGMVAHPATMLLERARRSFVRVAQEFGMTPASYARLPKQRDATSGTAEEALLRTFTG